MKNSIRYFSAVLLSICLMFVFIPSAFSVQGDTGTDGDFNWIELADGTVAVSGYSGGNIVNIPATLSGKAVTEIAENAFYSKFTISITSVTIPEGVKKIGKYAFHSRTLMTSVILPRSLREIGWGAFRGCSALTSVIIPEGVTTIHAEAFYDCSSLASVSLPSTLTNIYAMAFYRCTALISIDIPEGVTTISSNTFTQCTSLESISLPSTLVFLYGLRACHSLTSLEIPEGVVSIGGISGNSLENVSLPSTLRTIYSGTFLQCYLLSEMIIPESVKVIEYGVLKNCYGLEKVVILSPTVTIGVGVFRSSSLNNDGIYGYTGSTAEAFAAANGFPFHAVWVIEFDSQGGSPVPTLYKAAGHGVTAPPTPAKNGYEFHGWYAHVTPSQLTEIEFPFTVTGDMILYADWWPVSSPSASPASSPMSSPTSSPMSSPASSPTSSQTPEGASVLTPEPTHDSALAPAIVQEEQTLEDYETDKNTEMDSEYKEKNSTWIIVLIASIVAAIAITLFSTMFITKSGVFKNRKK
ncbi:MAG: leucine-rich repeat protein [Clostridia bacterium]|jgi:uncharacterized repeat protein (TIGR02543 family)|nr:leucine-rich repeat protein [Clostridia bacterium]